MILWLLIALAATPEELAEAVPGALKTLDRCAEEGCESAEGAKAAWIAAVHRYVDAGEADGMLSATVKALDATLFDQLPPVVQQAATSPMLWVDRYVEEPWIPPPVTPYTPKDKLPRSVLTVVAVHPDGSPVPNASVRFPVEGHNHRVNSETGRWSGDTLFAPDGTERFFQKGDLIELEVFAPGYTYTGVRYVLSRRKQNTVVVRMLEWTVAWSEDPDDPEAIARIAWRRWLAAEEALLADPREETMGAAMSARLRTAQAARDWMDAGGGPEARQLCLVTGTLQQCGKRSE